MVKAKAKKEVEEEVKDKTSEHNIKNALIFVKYLLEIL